ncbi:MAG: beta-galactosidase [Lachnospiraceae bacterium]
MSVLFPKIPALLHGGDYNPDQWLDRPDILEEDIKMMKKAGVNTATVGVFSWSALEPQEGNFQFGWLHDIMDKLYENGIYTVLATPTGARPAWMDEKYPSVLRVEKDGRRNHHSGRHNHCMSSLEYRALVEKMDTKLAQEFGNHPGLILWHISNEFGGECYCENCKKRFQEYLREKYHNNIEELNKQWWTAFWSRRFDSFEQIEPPYDNGEHSILGLNLDWKRFNSWNMKDYLAFERRILKKYTPQVPATANFMKLFEQLDYVDLAKEIDIISWDGYPSWNNDYETPADTAAELSFDHTVMRSLKKDKPFMLMESTPSLVNWHSFNKLKRPGILRASSIQTIGCGSDTVQYFQWRKGRGAAEQFHGAVVDHLGRDDTRVFKEVSEVGEILKKLAPVTGSKVTSKAAVLFDWSNRWAIKDMQGMAHDTKKYEKEVRKFYNIHLKKGINADIVFPLEDLSSYSLVVLPMYYAVSKEAGEWLKEYVKNGGTVVATYLTAYVNENTLAYLGGFPGAGLGEVFGLYAEELDTLYPTDSNSVLMKDGNKALVKDYCELIKLTGAEVLGTYESDFYAGMPAVTVHSYGKGKAYYIGTRMEETDLIKFFTPIWSECGIKEKELPEGVEYLTRTAEDGSTFDFYVNYNATPATVQLAKNGTNLLNGEAVSGKVEILPFNAVVVK